MFQNMFRYISHAESTCDPLHDHSTATSSKKRGPVTGVCRPEKNAWAYDLSKSMDYNHVS